MAREAGGRRAKKGEPGVLRDKDCLGDHIHSSVGGDTGNLEEFCRHILCVCVCVYWEI